MDALIRSPALASERLKLGVAAAGVVSSSAAIAVSSAAVVAREQDVERRALEQRLRQEVKAEFEKANAAEREAARQRGFAEGEREGSSAAAAAAERQRAAQQRSCEEALAALRRGLDDALAAVAERAADLAFTAVVRLVGEQAATREFVLGQVLAVLRHVDADQAVTVSLHPGSAALLRSALGALEPGHARAIAIVDDAELAPGACLVETPLGGLDASLETQLRRLREALHPDLAAAAP